jgi:hypothetical protein
MLNFIIPGIYKIKITQKNNDVSIFHCHDFQVVVKEPSDQMGFSPIPPSFGLKPG